MTHARRAFKDYVAHGLRVRSSVPLPFAFPSHSAGAADVTVRFGAAPVALRPPVDVRRRSARGDMEWEAASDVFLLRRRGIARYLVTAGCNVLVEPCGGDDREIGENLVDTAWAAVLLQRGVIPFHAGAVAFKAGAALFLGSSGAGKSSLIGALLKRGHALLADDCTGVASAADSRILALPAKPRLRLRADAMDKLGWRGRRSSGQYVKHPVKARRFHPSPLPICALYLLTSHPRSGIAVETVRGAAAWEALWPCVRQKRLVHGLGRSELFRVLTAMARQAPVARVTRPAHPFRLDALADRIETHMGELFGERLSRPAAFDGRCIPAALRCSSVEFR